MITVKHSRGEYPVHFSSAKLPSKGVVITDQNLAQAWGPHFQDQASVILEPGEQSKSLQNYAEVCSDLVVKGARRSSTLVAFGGGVIGDLVGFVAATYMRGMPFVQIPTSLLAMVDSSVGGKVGVDLPEGKNLVGAFYPPTKVFIDTAYLQTLPAREFTCGVAEVLKYALIMDVALYDDLAKTPLTQGDSRIDTIVRTCIQHKADVVAEDEFEEKGLRAILNFGHTVGHALEQITGYKSYTHGEAIAIGMVVEAEIAVQLGFAPPELTSKVKELMQQHQLPVHSGHLKDLPKVIQSMQRDKKSVDGEVSMSLVAVPGECKLVHNVPLDVIEAAWRNLGY